MTDTAPTDGAELEPPAAEGDTPPQAPAFALTIDLDSLTIGELDLFEEHADIAFEEIRDYLGEGEPDADGRRRPRKGRMKVLRALALVQLRRTDPSAGWDDTYSIRLPSRAEVEAGATEATVRSGTDPLG